MRGPAMPRIVSLPCRVVRQCNASSDLRARGLVVSIVAYVVGEAQVGLVDVYRQSEGLGHPREP